MGMSLRWQWQRDEDKIGICFGIRIEFTVGLEMWVREGDESKVITWLVC